MKLITLVLLVVAGTVSGEIFSEVNIQQHLEKVYEHRYPSENNQGARDSLKNYIKEKFRYYGLEVHEHNFNTTVSADPKGYGSEIVSVNGTNIIGIKPAVTNRTGAVVLVGADYDSNGLSDPLFYNGAGVAALLESAHVYTFNSDWSGRFVANFTTIFVAFDINTKHYQSSSGTAGGSKFVKEWLWPYIQRNPDYFGGAVILDSIMNVNYEPNTQTLTTGFQNLFPDTYKRVTEHEGRGDFLAMVSLSGKPKSKNLKDQFAAAFNRDRRAKRYRLEDMALKNGAPVDPIVELFIKSENVHFWTFKTDNGTSIQLPAILITDTTNYRTDPKTSCSTCRPVDMITKDRLEFINATVIATTHFLLDRQTTMLPPPPSSAVSTLPSALMTVLMMSLVRLYM